MRKSLPLILVWLTLSCVESTTRPDAPLRLIVPRTTRALWVDSWGPGLYTAAQCDRVIAEAERSGFNTLLVEVRKVGDAYYESEIEPRGVDDGGAPLDRTFDPLAYFIREAKARRGLRVEAWVVVNRVWKGLQPPRPSSPQHVTRAHPEWLLEDDHGDTRDGKAGNSVYLDPSDPSARQFSARIAADIAGRYSVDAVHLDYIRYPGGPWGFSRKSLARFADATNSLVRPKHGDAAFARWRADQVTMQVREIRNAVRRVNADCEVTVATLSWGKEDKRGYLSTSGYLDAAQDWPSWCREGLVDAVYVMHYKREADRAQAADFRAWFPTFHAATNGSHARLIVGLGAYLNSFAETRAQERDALAAGFAGTAHFSYRHPALRAGAAAAP